MKKYYAFGWDWKSQPPWDEILPIISDMSEKNPVIGYEVETGSDEYGLLLSDVSSLGKDKVFEIWEKEYYGEEEE